MDQESRGRQEFEALMGRQPEEMIGAVRDRSPELYETLLTFGFGGPMTRAELARPDRELATVAMLAALGGAEPQLETHAVAALHNGWAASELRALAEHVALYAGFPRGLNALAALDRALSAAGQPRPAAMTKVRLADHETVVAAAGDSGPAVLLVHALGLDWRMWEPLLPRLSAGRRVFAYDVRGHGAAHGSPAPFTMDDTADDLAAVLDAVGVDAAHVVGLSYGGGIAQTAAVRHPDRVASLARLGTTDHPFDAFEARARSAETDGMPAQVVPSLTRWFTPEALAVNGWGVRYARERVLRGDPVDWAAAWRSFMGLDVQGRLSAADRPTLVLAGERDASTTPEIMSAVAAAIPGATYQELPGTPHMQTLERPELVEEALDQYLPKA
jgi:3-oxoadipate enol-lactonase